MNFPIINLTKVWHVGEMDINLKNKGSLEGSGLSVSQHPNEWTQIAKLGGQPTYELKKDNSNFLNFHKLNHKQIEYISQWGIENKLVTKGSLYRISWYDERENLIYFDFTTIEEARMESEYEEEPTEIKDQLIPTSLLNKKVVGDIPPSLALDLLTTVFVEEYLNIDGIWWNDILDVWNYSAPRGVIFNNKVKEWNIKKIK